MDWICFGKLRFRLQIIPNNYRLHALPRLLWQLYACVTLKSFRKGELLVKSLLASHSVAKGEVLRWVSEGIARALGHRVSTHSPNDLSNERFYSSNSAYLQLWNRISSVNLSDYCCDLYGYFRHYTNHPVSATKTQLKLIKTLEEGRRRVEESMKPPSLSHRPEQFLFVRGAGLEDKGGEAVLWRDTTQTIKLTVKTSTNLSKNISFRALRLKQNSIVRQLKTVKTWPRGPKYVSFLVPP